MTTDKSVNPRQTASALSAALFLYMIPIFRRYNRNDLSEKQMYQCLDEDRSETLGNQLFNIWHTKHVRNKRYSLWRSLSSLFAWKLFVLSILVLIEELLRVSVLPLCIGRLVSLFSTDSEDAYTEIIIYASILMIYLYIHIVLHHSPALAFSHVGMKIRIACTGLIYKKMLQMKQSPVVTSGANLVNLLSNDLSKFDGSFVLLPYAIIGPIQCLVGLAFLYFQFGWAACSGIAIMATIIPIQLWLGKTYSTIRINTVTKSDDRITLMQEIIRGISVIKMYAWEHYFTKAIQKIRSKELKWVRTNKYINAAMYAFESFIGHASILVSIVAMFYTNAEFTAPKIFTIIAVYISLQDTISTLFSGSVTTLAEISVTVRRVQDFLDKEDAVDDSASDLIGEPQLTMANVRIGYPDFLRPKIVLYHINVDIQSKGLIAVIGPVGCGKSSFLNAVIKEVPFLYGNLSVQGRVSHVSQTSWFFTDTIRNNILFGNPYDEQRYRAVCNACALTGDFEQFACGDESYVAERGISLSGGQKARINLARCLYHQADIYLLDDPLSAVDANVAKHIFYEAIKNFLGDKICVLVTHQLQFLPEVDRIIVLENGTIAAQGSFEEVLESSTSFTELLHDYKVNKGNDGAKGEQGLQDGVDYDAEYEDDLEELVEGTVRKSCYSYYIKACGGYLLFGSVIALLALYQLITSGSDLYLTFWVQLEDLASHNHTSANMTDYNISLDLTSLNRTFVLYGYVAIIFCQIILSLLYNIWICEYSMRGSRNIHSKIFDKVINATMQFFNTNHSGRIVNRFSRDIDCIDDELFFTLSDLLSCFATLLGAIVMTSLVKPWLLAPVIFVFLLCWFVRRVALKTSRSAKRFEANARAPLYNHVSASIDAFYTIRCVGNQAHLTNQLQHILDRHSAAWYLFFSASRSFGFFVNVIAVVFISIVIVVLLFQRESTPGPYLGFILTQYINLLNTMQWCMRQTTEVENKMTSVERLHAYQGLEQENKNLNVGLKKSWPDKGKIEFRNVSLSYIEKIEVLKNLTFTIAAGEKIGIVGRTGAGKSSVMTALFQLYPLSSGSIFIDGLDIHEQPLRHLRSHISVIPQDPVLFNASVRSNLDPFDEFADQTLWHALELVELKQKVVDTAVGLSSEAGRFNHFSAGQKQLMCLARAIVRQNRILVMDEATANVDPNTDALIQKTIRKHFADCTVLTIAHRLNTVLDSDRILVLDAGNIVEFDTPAVLLAKEDGVFSEMYNNSKNCDQKFC